MVRGWRMYRCEGLWYASHLLGEWRSLRVTRLAFRVELTEELLGLVADGLGVVDRSASYTAPGRIRLVGVDTRNDGVEDGLRPLELELLEVLGGWPDLGPGGPVPHGDLSPLLRPLLSLSRFDCRN